MKRILRELLSVYLGIALILMVIPNIRVKAVTTVLWPLPSNYTTVNNGFNASSHLGIDIPAPKGTNIYAVYAGTVIYSGDLIDKSGYNSYGHIVIIHQLLEL